MRIAKSNIPSLTVILVKDPASGGYTSFFAQLPNIISEGDNEKEAIANLLILANDVFKHQKAEAIESAKKFDQNSVRVRNYPLVTA